MAKKTRKAVSDTVLELIKRSFNLFVKMRWLKEINKVVDARNRAYKKYVKEALVLDDLLKDFNQKYPNDVFKGE